MKTLFIKNLDVPHLLSMPELISALKQAYIAYSTSSIKTQKTIHRIEDTSVVITSPGWLPDSPYITVKVNAKSPNNAALGLPFMTGTILLLDQKTGQLLATMESGLITAMRTGAAGAIGVEYLAQKYEGRIALIGAGMQAEWQVKAINANQNITHVTIYDIVNEQAHKLANKLQNELNIKTTVVDSINNALENNNVLITTTQSNKPLISNAMLKPAMHINAFGADQRGKVELARDVFTNNYIVADDIDLACIDGALNVHFHEDAEIKHTVQSDIAYLIKNTMTQVPKDAVTFFANIGLAFQDLVACSIIYKNALANQEFGN